MKAGLMEIGDIFVMNKADHDDAESAAREIQDTLRLKDIPEGEWEPRVILTSAREETGIDGLMELIEEHRRYLEEGGHFAKMRKKILRSRVRNALMDRMERRLRSSDKVRELLEKRMESVYKGEISPYRLVRELEELVSIQ
jgi:LAO/AO transport system kinase